MHLGAPGSSSRPLSGAAIIPLNFCIIIFDIGESDPTLSEILEQPEHYKNAEAFIAKVIGEIAPSYPDLKFTATNETEGNLHLYPGAAEAARLEGDIEAIDEFYRMGDEIDVGSATATIVSVIITGDRNKDIDKATRKIVQIAKKLKGRKTGDTETKDHGGRTALKGIIDTAKLEDLPLFERYLWFRFKS